MDCLNPNLRMSENLSSVPCDPEKSTNVHLTDFLHNPLYLVILSHIAQREVGKITHCGEGFNLFHTYVVVHLINQLLTTYVQLIGLHGHAHDDDSACSTKHRTEQLEEVSTCARVFI